MATVAAGYYVIVNRSNSKAIDVSNGDMSDGANVSTNTVNGTDAEAWRVSYRSNGTAKITNKLSGKSLDVPYNNKVSGQKLLMCTDNDSRAQEWDLVDAGASFTIDGTSYPLFKIRCHDVTTLYGTVDGTDIKLSTSSSSNAQRWAFVPIAPFRSGGVYEIASMMDTTVCMDVAFASKTNGANVALHPRHGGNNQKFAFVDEGDGFSIRGIDAGKYVDVANAEWANNVNVQMYEDNDSRAQRWAVQTSGTTTVDGVTCQVARLVADNGTAHGGKTYSADAAGATTAVGTNIFLHESHEQLNQQWALIPTVAVDEFMPSPFGLSYVSEVGKTTAGGNTTAWGSSMSFRFYPTWECAPSWATSGPNGYQVRKRERFMSASTSTWGSWSAWSAWDTAPTTRSGQRSWLTDGWTVTMTNAKKLAQVEYEVRATGVDELSLLCGASASKTVTLYPVPAITVSAAGWSPEGIRLSVASTYAKGATVMHITSVLAGTAEILASQADFTKLDDATSILIPQSKLKAFPANGAQLSIAYTVGTDQKSSLSERRSAQVQLSYDSGSQSITPTFAEGSDFSLLVTVPNLGSARMWAEVDGEAVECEMVSSTAQACTFKVLEPLAGSYRLYATGKSSDGDDWYTWHAERTNSEAQYHAWSWDGGSVKVDYIKRSDSRPATTTEANYASAILNANPYEQVSFGATRKVRMTATGMLSELTDETRRDFQEMVGKHALYRSADGDYCKVAVLSVTANAKKYWTEVSVTMVREA